MASAAIVPGCVENIYDNQGKAQAAMITPRQQWRVEGDVNDPAYAIDGLLSTASTTGYDYDNATVTIDLGKICLFNMVVIDHGENENGFCRRLAMLTSTNGKTFIRRKIAPGNRRVSIICLISPILARYVRLQAISQGQEPWALAEIHMQ